MKLFFPGVDAGVSMSVMEGAQPVEFKSRILVYFTCACMPARNRPGGDRLDVAFAGRSIPEIDILQGQIGR